MTAASFLMHRYVPNWPSLKITAHLLPKWSVVSTSNLDQSYQETNRQKLSCYITAEQPVSQPKAFETVRTVLALN